LTTPDEFAARLPWPEFRTLYGYWRERCNRDRLPGRADIDPTAFPALLPGLYLVDVTRSDAAPPLGFRSGWPARRISRSIRWRSPA